MDIKSRTLVLSSLLSLVTTTPAYAELLIQTSESYTNSVALENNDLILNYGEFNNRAIVENRDGSAFINYGLVFNFDSMLFNGNSELLNYGDFDNFGDITANSINNHLNGSFENQSLIILHEIIDTTGSIIAAELNNSGEFNNNGVIDTYSSFQGFNLTNSNVFNNNGTIYTYGPTQITNSGVFNNSGEFNSSSDATLNITNSGEFINSTNLQLGNSWNPEGAGSITNTDHFVNYAAIHDGEAINNSGHFENNGHIQGINSFENSGDIINSGFIGVFTDLVNTAAANFNNLYNGFVEAQRIENRGVFGNQGVIVLHEEFDDASGSMLAAELNNSGEFNNDGTIDTYSSFQRFNLTNSNIFNNNGIIYTNGPTQITNSGVFNNSGEFNSSPDATLNITNSGEFINSTNLQLGNSWNPEGAGSIINTDRFVNHAEINYGEAVNNSGYFENNGNINNINSFENSGDVINSNLIGVFTDLVNTAAANFNNLYSGFVEAQRIENRGVFGNQGVIVLHEEFDYASGGMVAAELNNSGEFNNDGTIDTYSSFHGFNLINSNVFNNNGTIYTNGPTQITNSGVFNNSGEFNSSPDATLNITNSGEFINSTNLQLGNSWNPEGAGSIINTDRFVNHAEINYGEAVNNSGYFENNGNINNINSFENSGDVINSNLIGVFTDLVNTAAANFNNLYSGLVEAQRIENRGVFGNQGVIVLHEEFDYASGSMLAAELNNSGEFNNDGTIDTYSSFHGFNLINSNVFNNNGTIYTNGPTQITNSGVFNNSGEFNSSPDATLNITNSGEFINSTNLQLGNSWNPEGAGSIINTDRFVNHAEINYGEAVNNSGYFENNGNINNINSFENSGDVINSNLIGVFTDLVNTAAANFNNLYSGFVEAQRIENRGVFGNQGVIVLHEEFDYASGGMVAAELNNSGEFNNDGTIDTYSSFHGFNLINSNVFNNNGTIYTNGPTQITNYGTFSNPGFINTRENSLSINNYGNFINSESLVLGDISSGKLGQAVNRGTFVNNADILDGELFLNSGHLENNGDITVLTFENSGDVVNAGGIGTFYSTNNLTNLASGTFTNLYGSGAGSTHLVNQGVFDNQSLVRMQESYDFSTGQRSPAVLNNSGTFNNNGTIDSDSDFNLTNSGEFTNTYRASIYSHGDTQITNSGNFVNRGSIDVYYGSLNINNSGSFSNSGNYGLTGNNGNIDNTGTFTNHSSIIDFNNISSSGLLVNEGNISANTVSISGTLKGGGNISVGNGLYITESGTLSTTGLFDIMDVSGDLFLDGTIEFDTELYFYTDTMNVFGDVILGSSSILDVSSLDLWSLDVGSSLDLLLADSITGSFDNFYYDAMLGDGLSLEWIILDSYGQDLLRLSVVSSVPLPAAFWLFLSGAIGLLSISRKRRM